MIKECHHIIFKKQGGLDFNLNYKYLNSEDHRGDKGPHKDRGIDLTYKKGLERNLRIALTKEYYAVDELIEVLGLNSRQAHRAFRQVRKNSRGMHREDAIKRLLGDRFYL